ncbi:MAG: response regulator [Elusimicrobia bacterium]|nr:response regulator [Elusimicrobiota bacterium]
MLILVAEDDEGLRFLLTEFLEGMGHTVKSVENGMELVKIALNERPDLVMTDLHMPQMTGDSMIAMMDMYPDLSGIPIIVITGITARELASMGIPKEIPVLSKPFDFAKIEAEVSKIAGK